MIHGSPIVRLADADFAREDVPYETMYYTGATPPAVSRGGTCGENRCMMIPLPSERVITLQYALYGPLQEITGQSEYNCDSGQHPRSP
jgi:hypothetical protein